MADIFLSYNREDQATARLYADAFEAAGLSVWWDVTLRAGETYDVVTETALREARAVVVLWSPRSVLSRWVRAEATIADRNRTLVPAMIEQCERPIMFELTQTADLTHWNGDSADPAWQAFLTEVRRQASSSADELPAGPTSGPPVSPVTDQSHELQAMAQTAAATSSEKPTLGKRSTVGILPFSNRSASEEDDELVDALVEDLTAAISGNWGFRVLSYRTMAQYKGERIDIRQIAKDHDVDYVMEGNLRRIGSKVRITAQLVDAHNGAILWTQKFDRPGTELFELLDDMVEDFTAHIGVQLEKIELDRAVKAEKPDSAWDALKRAWYSLTQTNTESIHYAIANAKRAVELAPDYPVAVSTLGLCLGILYQREGSSDEDLLREALEHTRRALQMNGQHHIVQSQASLVNYYAQNWEDSLRLAESAYETSPNSMQTILALAGAYTREERYDEAMAMIEKFEAMMPRGLSLIFAYITKCWALYGMGRIDEAIETASQMLKLVPSDHTGLMMRPVLYAERGDWDLALRDISELKRCYPDETLELFLNTIMTSRLADSVREQNAKMFTELWNRAEEQKEDQAAMSGASTQQ